MLILDPDTASGDMQINNCTGVGVEGLYEIIVIIRGVEDVDHAVSAP